MTEDNRYKLTMALLNSDHGAIFIAYDPGTGQGSVWEKSKVARNQARWICRDPRPLFPSLDSSDLAFTYANMVWGLS